MSAASCTATSSRPTSCSAGVTVIDWGIARVTALDDRAPDGHERGPLAALSGATAAGAVMGTPAYMAPEQAAGRTEAIDARTDVFAIGAMLYELLAGRPPYRGSTAMATIALALEGARDPLDRVAPHAPAALRAIVERAMAHAPPDRYASASELAAALESYTTGALVDREPAALRWLTATLAALFALGLVYALAVTFSVTSSILQQGPVGLGVLFVAVDGAVLALLEWRTRGRYRLLPFGVAFALATFLGGLSGTASGIGQAYAGIAALADARVAAAALAEGLYESLGLLALSCLYAAVQAFLWALAHRAASARRTADAEARNG